MILRIVLKRLMRAVKNSLLNLITKIFILIGIPKKYWNGSLKERYEPQRDPSRHTGLDDKILKGLKM